MHAENRQMVYKVVILLFCKSFCMLLVLFYSLMHKWIWTGTAERVFMWMNLNYTHKSIDMCVFSCWLALCLNRQMTPVKEKKSKTKHKKLKYIGVVVTCPFLFFLLHTACCSLSLKVAALPILWLRYSI